MRCVFGLVLCVVLCYCGLQTLGAVATAMAAADNPHLSQRAAEAAGWKVVEKYHAVVYVASGLITLAVCSLPTLLARRSGFNKDEAWRHLERTQQFRQ